MRKNEAVKILVVEDEEDFRSALLDLLQLEGYLAEGVASIANYQVLQQTHTTFDLIILDRQLPDGEGLDILKALRKHSTCPAIVLSGAGSTNDKVRGFEADADAYLVKPVVTEELLAIIRKLTRSREKVQKDNNWMLDKLGWILVDPVGNAIKLTKNELRFLCCFVEKHGEPVGRAVIIDALGYKPEVYDLRRLEVLVRRLRKKLEDVGSAGFNIATVYGTGYVLNTPLKSLS